MHLLDVRSTDKTTVSFKLAIDCVCRIQLFDSETDVINRYGNFK
jgi:hypothetical protein